MYPQPENTFLRLISLVFTTLVLIAGHQCFAVEPLLKNDGIGEMRKQFRLASRSLEAGEIQTFVQLRRQLDDYPLAGYLDYRYMRRRIDKITADDINTYRQREYTTEFDTSRWADKLATARLNRLARRKKWTAFNALYSPRLADGNLKCFRVQALYKTKQAELAHQAAQSLWLTPRSLPKACDKPFARFIANLEGGSALLDGGHTDLSDLAWQRFIGAFISREITLATYLQRYLTADQESIADNLLAIYRKPDKLLKRWASLHEVIAPAIDTKNRAAIELMLGKRLVRSNPTAALTLIEKHYITSQPPAPSATTLHAALSHRISESLYLKLSRYLIHRQALKNYNTLPKMYRELGSPADDVIIEWRLRAEIANGHWDAIPSMIEMLSNEKQQHDRWRYWKIRAKQLRGELSEPETIALASLAKKSNFYGFMSAHLSAVPYHIQPQTVTANAIDEAGLRRRPAIARAIEYFIHEIHDTANREWASAVKNLSQADRIKASYLANQYQWHFQAINTLANAGAWRHYHIRFPEVLTDNFVSQASRLDHPPQWFYAVARQESALSPLARSHAGALGLMQLLPNTAKQQAKTLGMKYHKDLLLDHNYNITLGTAYLDRLHTKYNSIGLSSAAYNAGPRRVDQWLDELTVPLPMDAWIESIRFNETRQYVQNVLSFALIHVTIHPKLNADHNPWPRFQFAQAVSTNVEPQQPRLAKQ